MSRGLSARRLAPSSRPIRVRVVGRRRAGCASAGRSRRRAPPARSGAARRSAAAAHGRRSACGRNRRAAAAARVRRWRRPSPRGPRWRRAVRAARYRPSRTVTPTMPWPAAGTIASGSSTTLARVGQPEPLQAGIGQQRGGAVAGGAACRAGVCTLPRSVVMREVRARVQQLRLPAHRGGADQRARPAGRRTGRPDRSRRVGAAGSARRARPRASACRRARCRAAARSPGPSGCAPRSRCGRRRAPRGSPWRTAPCRRSRPGGGPAPRRRWCGWRAPRTRPCRAAPGRTGSTSRKPRVWISASGEPRVPTRSGRRAGMRRHRRAAWRWSWRRPITRRGATGKIGLMRQCGPVLGIETSCDETAAAVLDGRRRACWPRRC